MGNLRLSTDVKHSKGMTAFPCYQKFLAGKPAYYNHNQTDEKHKHRNFIDSMHHSQIKTRRTIRVVLPKPVAKYRT
jgi:hypothetical protein